ncbi:hypothetical protein PHJA_000728300 [Phtheirospermum japonicum]|uniref:Uncharacterized protein n=1 Tax=Phtheirospermum japonicum TaxID=374723 RepID=A0A830BPU1_9LAMI|nr:hypothetical protein PHJA_000728300 [Phtheirospermum japonicum]
MLKHKLQSDSKYRGGIIPSVSRFRSGHMPLGMTTVTRDYTSESDMDTCSDSDGERRYSLEASPQDDKVPNGRRFLFADDESSVSVSSSEVTTARGRRNGVVVEKKFKAGAHFLNSNSETVLQQFFLKFEGVFQEFRNVQPQNNFDIGIPSAPPLAGSFQHVDQVSKKLPTPTGHAKPSLATAAGGSSTANMYMRTKTAAAASASTNSAPAARYPTFHASGLGHWYGVISYDACVRLCLHSWARDERKEATTFLANECALLRDAFGLRNVLLQSEDELLRKQSSELVVRKVKMGFDPPTGCTFASIKATSIVKLGSFQHKLSSVKSIVSSERKALRQDRVTPAAAVKGSLLHQSMAYIVIGTRRYLKEVPELVKIGFNALRSNSSSNEEIQETYSCLLRLKSSPEEEAVRMQPGSSETRVFLPDGLGDDLVIEVHDSKGRYCGQAALQVADLANESWEKVRPCFIYREPDHEQVGKIQLHINYSTTPDENGHKCASVAETIAYDCVLETAMKIEQFQQRKLKLNGDWKWLVKEFASYFGVSDAYTKLRYLSYVMDVATPTADCLDVVHELLQPVVIKGKTKHSLSHQEVRMLGEVSEQIEQILALVFENFKSLDELLPTGIVDAFGPATGVAAPALAPALKLYKLLHDILSPEAQSHLSETDEFVSNNTENILMDPVALSTAYKKMKSLCLNIQNEILTDIEIHKQDLLPSFINLPNLSSAIYSTELCSRLRAFLVSCPPAGPTSPVVALVIATADFQRDLALWNIGHIKGGVDAKELFHVYITLWIQDKRLALLEFCKLDKVKSFDSILKQLVVKPPSLPTQYSTTCFIDDIYGRLNEMLAEYDVIISRWPDYTLTLENAIADVEKAVVESLEKQYAEVLSPLKENTMPLGFKYVQKFAKGHNCPYNVTTELGVLLNSIKRMLDTLRPQIEAQLKLWGSCMPETGNMVPGECLSELKKIIQDAKENFVESDFRHRMQPLKELLSSIIDQLHAVFETQVFVIVCRGFWDRMGQDVLKFLEDRKENRAWYKASRVAVSVLDDTFASQMQQLLGNTLQEKDFEPPRCMMEVRSMLCKDAVNHKENNYYF